MNRVALETLGCKLNQAETEYLAKQFHAKECQLVESALEADIYVLNTCTVTHIADRKARQLLRSARRNNPKALIVAIGCYAQRAPQELDQLGVVDLILDNEKKYSLTDILKTKDLKVGREGHRNEYLGRTRSIIKIQEGCSNYCSFCIVPYTRGKERSLSLEEVLHETDARIAAGYNEIILTGTRIGAYGKNGQNSSKLPLLIEHILSKTKIKRLRLSSLQPKDLTPELLRLWSDNRLCPHLHIPLQSGSQVVLQRMNRQYSITDYRRAVSLSREKVPNIAITTDVIVGFPGESEREFEESYRFCKEMDFANIHVFPYSLRLGTSAALMSNQVNERIKRKRSQRMLDLAQRNARRFRERFLGQTMTVLWETKIDQEIWSGLTANYLRAFTRSKGGLSNRLLPVRFIGEYDQGLLGELVYGG